MQVICPHTMALRPCLGNPIPRVSSLRKSIAIRPSVSSGDAYPQQQKQSNREPDGIQEPGTSGSEVQGEGQQHQPGFWKKVKTIVLGDKKMDRQRLAELGFGAFCAYGVISNLNA
ncbi:hypothetical protein DUNSADRAFT_16975 [Dunaliella salina]|uniref:Uncharacterized protein n=1 Tax=Dunaliella salina TaxID=3046 RepID=A0ABQ7G2M1_DUNSA|nr:hypothetical protein DUNSADRAFT_16975 [Dunaliella salina]|eukprot:KAF5828856.1 hypothetical protein DUNSADRAFT_16975 [Dunaliella salina]